MCASKTTSRLGWCLLERGWAARAHYGSQPGRSSYEDTMKPRKHAQKPRVNVEPKESTTAKPSQLRSSYLESDLYSRASRRYDGALARMGDPTSEIFAELRHSLNYEHFDDEGNPTEEGVTAALEIAEQTLLRWFDGLRHNPGQWLAVDVLCGIEFGKGRWTKFQKTLDKKARAARK